MPLRVGQPTEYVGWQRSIAVVACIGFIAGANSSVAQTNWSPAGDSRRTADWATPSMGLAEGVSPAWANRPGMDPPSIAGPSQPLIDNASPSMPSSRATVPAFPGLPMVLPAMPDRPISRDPALPGVPYTRPDVEAATGMPLGAPRTSLLVRPSLSNIPNVRPNTQWASRPMSAALPGAAWSGARVRTFSLDPATTSPPPQSVDWSGTNASAATDARSVEPPYFASLDPQLAPQPTLFNIPAEVEFDSAEREVDNSPRAAREPTNTPTSPTYPVVPKETLDEGNPAAWAGRSSSSTNNTPTGAPGPTTAQQGGGSSRRGAGKSPSSAQASASAGRLFWGAASRGSSSAPATP